MIKKILPILLALSVLLTACGAQGTPTMSPADVEGTAVSAAWTMVAATQNAIPTITPLPPTEIPSPSPLPTFTPLALPTLPLVLPTSTTAASAGNCLGPIDFGEAGKLKRGRIQKKCAGALSPVSLDLWAPNAFGQCGAMSLNMNIGGKEIVELPVGSWYAYAWVNLKNGTQSTAEGSFILPQGGDDLVLLKVNKDRIFLKGP